MSRKPFMIFTLLLIALLIVSILVIFDIINKPHITDEGEPYTVEGIAETNTWVSEQLAKTIAAQTSIAPKD